MVVTNPSLLNDSSELIKMLKDIPYKQGHILAAIDVNSLYAGIKKQDGVGGSKTEPLKQVRIKTGTERLYNREFGFKQEK